MREKDFPRHIALIMDGNGRWAEKRSLPRLSGHNAGMKAMKEIVKHSSEIGLEYLTVYAFSTENWKRSKEEVGGIFRLLCYYVENELKELCDNNVRVRILGAYEELPKDAYEAVCRAIEETKDNTGLQFCIALNYGGRAEILRAVNSLVCEKHDIVDEELFSSRLYTSGMPDPDLLIRTSGEERISNFLLWQLAYSEMAFTETLWPDFTPDELDRLIEEYRTRERRYGGRLKP